MFLSWSNSFVWPATKSRYWSYQVPLYIFFFVSISSFFFGIQKGGGEGIGKTNCLTRLRELDFVKSFNNSESVGGAKVWEFRKPDDCLLILDYFTFASLPSIKTVGLDRKYEKGMEVFEVLISKALGLWSCGEVSGW